MTTEESVELSLQDVVGLLRPYVEARDQETSSGKQRARLGELLKHYLERHPGEVVYDGESGLEASLQERQGAAVYEMDRMPEDLVLLLHRHGALKVDGIVLKALAGHQVAEQAKAYARPGAATVALNVKETK